ncbi:MAG: GntR family transcriptional regulator [Steroidobacteraceae bacterium]
MSKREPTAPVVLRPRAQGRSLHSWLYDELHAAIVECRLAPGVKLPSRKALALQYRVSVTTVVAAAEKLVQHGYLDARAGSGTYVRGASAAALTQRGRKGLSERGRWRLHLCDRN